MVHLLLRDFEAWVLKLVLGLDLRSNLGLNSVSELPSVELLSLKLASESSLSM